MGTRTTELVAVASGVHAWVQPDGGWCLNNAGLIVDGGAAVLVDTAATERRARALAAAVGELAPSGPDFLVNTHFHGDHTFGNAYFKPRAVIVAHEHCRRDHLAAGHGLRGLWPDVEWGETPIVGADVTYAGESAALYAGGRTITLLHPGTAHTEGDTVVWLPDDGVLFAGDVLWSDTTPFCLMGSVTGSLAVIDRLRALGAETVVPGHGPVGGPELLDRTESYLSWLLELARSGLEAGHDVLEVARRAQLGRFAELIDSERVVGNLHRAYAELSGAEADIAAAFGEMITFHGGLPICTA
ncbi:cyclase [Streptacidiphilus sp. MAP12-33]|uniref:MBL fold metallo-hydrolase n=1 Tax=Streptacidiphilus sp. MAP12-33 TaxID=3156266 RepID=UPI0035130BF8